MKKYLRFVWLTGVLVFAAAARGAGAESSLTGPMIMKKVAEAYAAVSSYQDSGYVHTQYPDKPEPDEVRFRTFFTRPSLFCFEWVTHHPYPPLRHITKDWIVWANEGGAYLSGLGNTRSGTLASVVAGATGVSSGSAHHIPRLLTSAITGFALTDLSDVQLLGEEPFENVPCFHLRGNGAKAPYELWVGRDDYLIRRITREILGKPVEEVRRGIKVNEEIPRSVFERDIP